MNQLTKHIAKRRRQRMDDIHTLMRHEQSRWPQYQADLIKSGLPLNDNVTLPPTGAGTSGIVAATDTIAGVEYQKIKIFDATADSTFGLVVDINGYAQAKTKYDTVTAVTAAWTSATALNSTTAVAVTNMASVQVAIDTTGTVTGGVITWEASVDGGTTWRPISGNKTDTGSYTATDTMATGRTASYLFNVATFTNFRVKLTTVIAGSGTVNLTLQPSAAAVREPINPMILGTVASGGTDSGNPVKVGGKYNTTLPTFTDGQRGDVQIDAKGNLRITDIDPRIVNKCAQYTTTQTGTALWTPASGKIVVIVAYQIQVGGTTAGTMQLWYGASGDTTYSRGTDEQIFDGEFAPSATLKPGVVAINPNGWRGAADDILRVTDSAAINPITVGVWGWEE